MIVLLSVRNSIYRSVTVGLLRRFPPIALQLHPAFFALHRLKNESFDRTYHSKVVNTTQFQVRPFERQSLQVYHNTGWLIGLLISKKVNPLSNGGWILSRTQLWRILTTAHFQGGFVQCPNPKQFFPIGIRQVPAKVPWDSRIQFSNRNGTLPMDFHTERIYNS